MLVANTFFIKKLISDICTYGFRNYCLKYEIKKKKKYFEVIGIVFRKTI